MTLPNKEHRPRHFVHAAIAFLIAIAGGSIAAGFLVDSFGRASLVTPDAPAALLFRDKGHITVPDGSPLRGKLIVETVGRKAIDRTLILPAVVEADPAHLVKIFPPLGGRITQLRVQLGQRVQAGQALLVLNSSDLGAAYSDYDRAKVVLEQAQRTRERQRALAEFGGTPDKDLQQAETDLAAAQADFKRAQARLSQIGVSPDAAARSQTLTLKAPMAGSVIDLTAATGAYWNDATAPMMTIADLATVWVTASVPESDIGVVKQGQPVDIVFTAYPTETFKGQVLFVSDVVDPDTRRAKVRIAFPNADIRAKPGMFANVTFHSPPEIVAIVPTTAILLRNDSDHVFVEVAPWIFEPRAVETRGAQDDQTIIRKGLNVGDRVVTRGGILLND